MIKTRTDDCLKAYIFGTYNLINRDVYILKLYVIVFNPLLYFFSSTLFLSFFLNQAICLLNNMSMF